MLALEAVWGPNVINVYETFTERGLSFMILEYCPGGSLLDLIKQEGPIRSDRLYSLCLEVLDALNSCHETGIAHLDIKPQNILFDKFDRAKLSDFGCAIRASKCLCQQFRGSPGYAAPEIVKHQAYDPFKADVWSLGVTFYLMVCGHLPWNVHSEEYIRAMQYGLEESDPMIPADFLRILRKMLVVDPEGRATLSDVRLLLMGKKGKNIVESKSIRRITREHSESTALINVNPQE
jgi:serine/threonine protein kinase